MHLSSYVFSSNILLCKHTSFFNHEHIQWENYNMNMFSISATDKEAAKIEQWKRQVILQHSVQRHTLSIPPDQ